MGFIAGEVAEHVQGVVTGEDGAVDAEGELLCRSNSTTPSWCRGSWGRTDGGRTGGDADGASAGAGRRAGGLTWLSIVIRTNGVIRSVEWDPNAPEAIAVGNNV